MQERRWMPFFVSKWQNDLEGQGQWPHFRYQLRESQDTHANFMILAQIKYKLSCIQAKFPWILSQNGQSDLEGQGQWPPFSIPAESIPGYMFGANLGISAQICDELLHGQAEFPIILSQNCQNDLEGQGQWPPFSIPIETIPRCRFGTNLVIPAHICDGLLCRQGKVYGRTNRQTDRQTDGQTQATTIPLRPERRRRKSRMSDITESFRDIINWIFYINNTITDIINSNILVIYKNVLWIYDIINWN